MLKPLLKGLLKVRVKLKSSAQDLSRKFFETVLRLIFTI